MVRRQNSAGFTLIELLIVVGIIGILAAVAIPSYNNYIIKSNRRAAQSFMMDVANKEKQYLLDARSYTSDLSILGMSTPSEVSRNYDVTVTPTTGPLGFTITATPRTGTLQVNDSTLTLTDAGVKTPPGKW